jgi:uncharacterized protein YebE (UPF0316 family)
MLFLLAKKYLISHLSPIHKLLEPAVGFSIPVINGAFKDG